MAKIKVTGRNFNENLTGLQLTQGSTLFTIGNFQVTTNFESKVSKEYNTKNFSRPVTLSDLNYQSDEFSATIEANQSAKLNLDPKDLKNYSYYGSLSEYIRVTVDNIILSYPASIHVNNIITGETKITVLDYRYDGYTDTATFRAPVSCFENDFNLIYLSGLTATEEFATDKNYRNICAYADRYCVSGSYGDFNIISFTGSSELGTGYVYLEISGNPFPLGSTTASIAYHIKPQQKYQENFYKNLKPLEAYLLNRQTSPIFTSTFKQPVEEDGVIVLIDRDFTWPLSDGYNLDIFSEKFDAYYEDLLAFAESYDNYKSNLIARFLTTDAIQEFDTPDQHVDKLLKVYGRQFDEIKHFIDGLAVASTISYNKVGNTPDIFVKNLARMFGWNTTAILSEADLLSQFIIPDDTVYSGYSAGSTPAEVDVELWRRIILNSAWLFKSKGTRKAIEFIFRFLNVPSSLVDFDEHVYLVSPPPRMTAEQQILAANTEYPWVGFDKTEKDGRVSGSTYTMVHTASAHSFQPGDNVYMVTEYGNRSYQGQYEVLYTGNTSGNFPDSYFTINLDQTKYGQAKGSVKKIVNAFNSDNTLTGEDGLPNFTGDSRSDYFQISGGWIEENREHVGPYDRGQQYFDKYRRVGYKLERVPDNRKAWSYSASTDSHTYTLAGRETNYTQQQAELLMNTKEISLSLDPASTIEFDLYQNILSNHCPISSTGSTAPYSAIDFYGIEDFNFRDFLNELYRKLLNVRNRKTIRAYPTLKQVYLDYLNAAVKCAAATNRYDYETLIRFTGLIDTYWFGMVEQFIPATTIWQGGEKYRNTLFDRQKFIYKKGTTEFCSPTGVTHEIMERPGLPALVRLRDDSSNVCSRFFDYGSEFRSSSVQQSTTPPDNTSSLPPVLNIDSSIGAIDTKPTDTTGGIPLNTGGVVGGTIGGTTGGPGLPSNLPPAEDPLPPLPPLPPPPTIDPLPVDPVTGIGVVPFFDPVVATVIDITPDVIVPVVSIAGDKTPEAPQINTVTYNKVFVQTIQDYTFPEVNGTYLYSPLVSTGATINTSNIVTGDTLPVDITYSAVTDSFTSTTEQVNVSLYKYNTASGEFSTGAVKVDNIPLSAFTGFTAYTGTMDISALEKNAEYIVKLSYDFSGTSIESTTSERIYSSSAVIADPDLLYGIYDPAHDSYFAYLPPMDTPQWTKTVVSAETIGLVTDSFTVPSAGQTNFYLSREPAGSVSVTINGVIPSSTYQARGRMLYVKDAAAGDQIKAVYDPATCSDYFVQDYFPISDPVSSGDTGTLTYRVFYNTGTTNYEFFTRYDIAEPANVMLFINGVEKANGVDFFGVPDDNRIIILSPLATPDEIYAFYEPKLYSDYPQGTLTGTTVSFGWEVDNAPNTDGEFHLEISTHENIDPVVLSAVTFYNTGATSYSLSVGVLDDLNVNTTYYYRVSSLREFTNLTGQTYSDTIYSDVGFFDTDNITLGLKS